MFAVEIDEAAVAELRSAVSEYEAVQSGLGRRFLQEIVRCRKAVASMPRRFPRLRGFAEDLEVRRALCDDFPFSLVFSIIEDDRIRVLAVAHVRREPGYWIDRIVP